MNDALPPDLPRLRVLETWLGMQLERVRTRITQLERQETERQRAQAARPPAPDWLLETGISANQHPVAVHVGGCHMAGKRSRSITRTEAAHALTSGVEACPHCRPDTELGIID